MLTWTYWTVIIFSSIQRKNQTSIVHNETEIRVGTAPKPSRMARKKKKNRPPGPSPQGIELPRPGTNRKLHKSSAREEGNKEKENKAEQGRPKARSLTLAAIPTAEPAARKEATSRSKTFTD